MVTATVPLEIWFNLVMEFMPSGWSDATRNRNTGTGERTGKIGEPAYS
jgi:hypothetical protein